jgi:hypothetical protein
LSAPSLDDLVDRQPMPCPLERVRGEHDVRAPLSEQGSRLARVDAAKAEEAGDQRNLQGKSTTTVLR